MAAEPPVNRTVRAVPRIQRTRIDCQELVPEALTVPVRPITLPWLFGVLGYDGTPMSAGDPCPHHPACGNAAGMVALYPELEDAEARARDELVCAARARGAGDVRVIQRLRVERLPGKDFTRVGMPAQLMAEARYVLSKGIGEEPWWTLVKETGCQAALLTVPRGHALFLFQRSMSHLQRRGEQKRITLD